MKTLRVGLVGAGHLGRIHARLLGQLEGVQLAAVAEPVAETRRLAAVEAHAVEFADYRDLVGHVDAAIVATPTHTHHAVAMELLRNGIHVLVEKPLAPTVAEAEELVWTARWHGALLQVGHIERFNPALLEVPPKIGRPRMIETVRQSGYTFRSTDIGVVLDLMIHDLDLLLWLGGAPIRSVAAAGWSVFGGHEDVAQARIELANGCVANLSASRVSHRPCRRMQIWTARGHAEIDFATGHAAVAELVEPAIRAPRQHLPLGQPQPRFEELLPLRQWDAPKANALLDEQRDFIECIQTGRPPRVSGEDGLRAVEAAGRVLAKLAEHGWEETAAQTEFTPAPTIPPSVDRPDILRGPHWDRHPAEAPAYRKEAG